MSEQLRLFDIAPNALFSCIYRENDVSCVQQSNGKAPPVAQTTDEAGSTVNALAHAEAEASSLCPERVESSRCAMDARQAKGFALATNSEIIREGNIWIVPSESSSKTYIA